MKLRSQEPTRRLWYGKWDRVFLFLFSLTECHIAFLFPWIEFMMDPKFWGSSILSSQQDAVKTAKELNAGTVVAADVMGISLSTLVKNTMLAFQPEGVTGSDHQQQGGRLIIKMDVEGAEYQVLKESAASGVVCDFIKLGNRVVFVVEYHNNSFTDPQERKREKSGANQAIEALKQCGVQFLELQSNWA